VLWLLLSRLDRADLPLAVPTLAWVAEAAGARLEMYAEAERDGRLFARTGSTVLGGHHHQQFNYLCGRFDVRVLKLGPTRVFDSSVAAFGLPVIAATDALVELYRAALAEAGVSEPPPVLTPPPDPADIAPYLFPEIFHRRALAVPDDMADRFDAGRVEAIELVGDDIGTATLETARRWADEAEQVAFGDPPAILAQLADHCRQRRVAVWAPVQRIADRDAEVSAYAEQTSPIADAAAELAERVGNRVLVGRQTGDGDIFQWSKRGVCIQIIDPNRPAFPAVAGAPHRWTADDDGTADEPSDAQLQQWIDERRLLATLVWHSGEVAHNEAMLQLFDLACWAGVKMGVAVHAQRYETCPQMWELLATPRDAGGVAGLIEPVLHAGGLGVLAECHCPPDRLVEHCTNALDRIRAIAGDAGTPSGYYAFMDVDRRTLRRVQPPIYRAIAQAGLRYVVSSAEPGRNRVVHTTDGCIAINQSPRVVCPASPFVRMTTVEDAVFNTPRMHPGWFIGTLDAPVIAFNPYIWREGSRFMRIVEWLTGSEQVVNVTPRVVARYARLLTERDPAERDPAHARTRPAGAGL